MFLQYDEDESGALDRKEFKRCLSEALGLSKKEVRKVLEEADDNGDGVLEYREFMPTMVQVMHAIQAKASAQATAREQDEKATAEAEHQLLHGMSKEELESLMSSIFEMADEDGSGTLSRKEFVECLSNAKLGLSRKEINLVLSEVDADGDGNVSYQEFAPLCFQILLERFKEEVMEEEALKSEDALMQLLLEAFQAADKEGVGLLKQNQLKKVLLGESLASVGLSKLQAVSILAEATPDSAGMVKYALFAPVAATMIYSMVDAEAQKARLEAVGKIGEVEGVEMLRGMGEESVKRIITEAFHAADADSSGTLDEEEIVQVLQQMGASELALKPSEINALTASIDDDGDGQVTYAELVDFMYEALAHLEREALVQEMAFNRKMDDMMLAELEAEAEAGAAGEADVSPLDLSEGGGGDEEQRERGRTARAARHGEIEDAVRDGEGDL